VMLNIFAGELERQALMASRSNRSHRAVSEVFRRAHALFGGGHDHGVRALRLPQPYGIADGLRAADLRGQKSHAVARSRCSIPGFEDIRTPRPGGRQRRSAGQPTRARQRSRRRIPVCSARLLRAPRFASD
jgi:hypothetical protein